MHIQFYPDKRHLIYKTNILQHCTEISQKKHQEQFQMATTFYIYILFVSGIRNLWLSFLF